MTALTVLLFTTFWAGVALLFIFVYKQFAAKEGAPLLAWGMGLVFVTLALWCASIWFSLDGNLFGGWGLNRLGGMMSMMSGYGQNVSWEDMEDWHNQMHQNVE